MLLIYRQQHGNGIQRLSFAIASIHRVTSTMPGSQDPLDEHKTAAQQPERAEVATCA